MKQMERFLEESNAPTYGQTFLHETMRGYGAETFEAKGYKGISASKIQVLEKYIENGGKALDYHELPYHIQRQLEMGRVHELMYQDVNRWLQDNAPNPHHTMPSWLSAEEGRVRTMSGKPHTPRKLRKDQNIKPEEARMRKKMEAQSKGKSKCSKHYWDVAVRRNPISGERQFFNQCLLCGKKDFSRGGSAMSDRGFFAEDLKMESYCGSCDKRTEISKYPQGANFCVCGRGKSIIVDGYELGSSNETPQHIKQFLRSKGKRDYGAESYQVREGFDTCETCGDSPLFVSTQIAGGTYCMDCAGRVWRAESPFKSDAFNEGRSAGITMFVPEGDAEDYYSNLDTEYMIFYGLSPEDLAKDIDGNSKRYLQFVAGWDDGWNYATLLHEGVLTDDSDNEGDLEDLDYEMAGEWVYQDLPKGLQEYVPSPKEIGAEVAVIGGIVALGLGYFAFKNKIGFKGETFNATESCSEDEDCPDGKVCVDGKCLPICVDDGDCASWRECRDDLHPTEKVCGEDKTDSNDNPFDFIKKEENQVDEPTETSATKDDTYSTTTKTIIGVGIVGAIGVGIKVLGGMKDKGDE